jgi:hypothetical protein
MSSGALAARGQVVVEDPADTMAVDKLDRPPG